MKVRVEVICKNALVHMNPDGKIQHRKTMTLQTEQEDDTFPHAEGQTS